LRITFGIGHRHHANDAGPASGVGTIVVEHPTNPRPKRQSVEEMKALAWTVEANSIARAMAFIGLLLSRPKDQSDSQ
jgi:hypothetical protein